MPTKLLLRLTFSFFRSGCALAFLVLAATLHAETNRQHAVEVSAFVQDSPAQIQLVWPARSDATEYRIFRRAPGGSSWGSAIFSVTTSAATSTGVTDTSISVGQLYEYQIQCFTSTINSTTTNSSNLTAYGYCWAGIKAPATETRGTVVLLVDNTVASALASHLDRFIKDLVGDGWKIIRHDVDRYVVGTNGWKEAVVANRALVIAAKAADPAVSTVILVGHVPVPYSGLNFFPDGHPDHKGAWPADLYYGDVDGSWTDTGAETSAARAENKNSAGDGKFDQTTRPSEVDLMVGRIDLSRLPAFSQSETDLLKRYFDKDHAFRHAQVATQRRGLVDANIGSNLTSKHSAAAFRSFAALFGSSQIVEADFFSTLSSQPYLFAYGDGGGTYNSSDGVGNTAKFVASSPQAVFTTLFGSYFGDWDNQNNLLRAPLAAQGHILTCAWNGRPFWNFHPMGMGETIGYVTRYAQNNHPNLGYHSPNTFLGVQQVHIALMGDPTLRLHPVKPASNLTGSFDFSNVQLSWNASADTGIVGYHVYRGTSATGPFTRLTGSTLNASNPSGAPLVVTSYTDPISSGGDYFYMIRAVKLEASATGTYYNLSQGIFIQPSAAVISNGLQTFRNGNSLAANGSQDLLSSSGDGVANLQKYAFNMIGSGTGQALNLSNPNSTILSASGSAGLPLVGVGTGSDAGKLQITYIRRKAASNSGISYAVEFSDALASWAVNTSATSSIPVSIDTNYERVIVTDLAVTGKRFVRLKLTTP